MWQCKWYKCTKMERFHRIFSSTSVHREQECGRFCASVEDVATKTPNENARNRVGSDRSFEGAANHIAALRSPHQDPPCFAECTDCGLVLGCGKPWKTLSGMCGSNPKQRTICKRWFTFQWCQAFHHHFAEGHERAQKLMLQVLLGQDCTARCLGQEAVLNRWRLSTRLGSVAPLLSLPPRNHIKVWQ